MFIKVSVYLIGTMPGVVFKYMRGCVDVFHFQRIFNLRIKVTAKKADETSTMVAPVAVPQK